MNFCEYISNSTKIKYFGRGEYGEVSLQRGPDQRLIIIKSIHNNELRKYGLGLIIREINSMSIVKTCPSIIDLYGFCFWSMPDVDVNEEWYLKVDLIMEPMTGDLTQLELSIDKVPQLLQSMLQALSTLESVNISHNDISKQNIFYRITPHGYEFKLGDFGLSTIGPIAGLNPEESDLRVLIEIIAEYNSDDPWVRHVITSVRSSKVRARDFVVPCPIINISQRWEHVLGRKLIEEEQIALIEVEKGLSGQNDINLNMYGTIGRLMSDLGGRLLY